MRRAVIVVAAMSVLVACGALAGDVPYDAASGGVDDAGAPAEGGAAANADAAADADANTDSSGDATTANTNANADANAGTDANANAGAGAGEDANADSGVDSGFDAPTVATGDASTIIAVDISSGAGNLSGYTPSIAIDDKNGKVLVVARDDVALAGKPALFRCNLDGTGCTYTDISAGAGSQSGTAPSIAIDSANAKLLVVTEDWSSGDKAALFRCDLDGTNCTYTDVSAGGADHSGQIPAVAIDAVNAKLLFATLDVSNADRPRLTRCELDGTSCTATDISSGQGAGSGWTPTIAIDSVNGKVLVVTEDYTNLQRASLFRCDLDGTHCTWTDVSAGQGASSGFYPSIAIDVANAKLLIATMDGSSDYKLSLSRCDLDGSNCAWSDLSAGRGRDCGGTPSMAIDAANGRLVVVTYDGSNLDEPWLARCELDGTGCVAVDFSAGLGSLTGLRPKLALGANGGTFVVTQNWRNVDRPELFIGP